MRGFVAIVLHAHLPYVRHPEHPRSLEERWLFEALWETYLPLLDVLGRLYRDGVRAPLTISLSPPLVAMLRDPLLQQRFEQHLDRLEALAQREETRPASDSQTRGLARFYRGRIDAARATWEREGRDVVSAFARFRDEGDLELWTTSATHAYLPGLASASSVRAQITLGQRSFEAATGKRATGFWLPECAFDPRFEGALARASVGATVLDAHGLLLARPRPPLGLSAPIASPRGIAFFARDPLASHEVWSRAEGYPGHPDYRDFYRDVGFDRDESELATELGPSGSRVFTGLKYHRITGPEGDKALYDPERANARARLDAADFCARRLAALEGSPRGEHFAPIAVAPYDAELFGHWWFEGPVFLEHVLRELSKMSDERSIGPATIAGYLDRYPYLAVAEPAASSWGEGGFGIVWTGPRTASLLKRARRVERRVFAALEANKNAEAFLGRALDQALRELLLLQSSDFAFMIERGEAAAYGERRAALHEQRATRLAAIVLAGQASEADRAWVEKTCEETPLFAHLPQKTLREAFAQGDAEGG